MKKAKEVKDKLVAYINDLRSNGLTNLKEKVKNSFKNNVVVHFQSKENLKKMVSSLKERISIDRATQKINNWLEKVNNWAMGLDK